jgi:hypothetical protein
VLAILKPLLPLLRNRRKTSRSDLVNGRVHRQSTGVCNCLYTSVGDYMAILAPTTLSIRFNVEVVCSFSLFTDARIVVLVKCALLELSLTSSCRCDAEPTALTPHNSSTTIMSFSGNWWLVESVVSRGRNSKHIQRALVLMSTCDVRTQREACAHTSVVSVQQRCRESEL